MDVELRQDLEADTRQGALQRLVDLGRKPGDRHSGVLGDDDLPLLAERPLARRLLGRVVEDVLVDVVVDLVDRDLPVLVAIGGSAAQAFDQVVREERVLDVADHLVALPGVLRRVGCGQHDASAAGALERRGGADGRALRRFGPEAECAAVTAIEDQHEALRRAAVHPRGHVRRFDGGAREHRSLGVAHGEIEVALLVTNAVAGEVEEQEVVAMLGVEEPGDRLAHGREAFVQERDDFVETADAWRLENLGERADVDVGRREPRETRILILAVADDERELARHDSSPLIAGAASRSAASECRSSFE